MIRIQQNTTEAEAHFQIIKKPIVARIKKVLKSGINRNEKDGTSRHITISGTFRNYLTALQDENELRNIVCCQPIQMPGMINSIDAYHPYFFSENTDQNYVLRNIFISHGYDKEWFVKLAFIKAIELDTCPYCNRNYIYYLEKGRVIKPQIDHFYPQSKYPLFGLSFYNLIPACSTCNGLDAKAANDPVKSGLKNPYLISDDDFLFSYKIKNIDFLNPLADKKSVEVKLIKKIKSNCEVFKLEELYALHSDHVLELVLKSKVQYADEFREYLRSYNKLKFSDEEIDRMILGNYTTGSTLHRRPFAKMYHDIGKELGLIE